MGVFLAKSDSLAFVKRVIKLAWPCVQRVFDFLHSIISVNCISLCTPFVSHFLSIQWQVIGCSCSYYKHVLIKSFSDRPYSQLLSSC